MKKLFILLVLTGCTRAKTYRAVSIDVSFRDTLDIQSNNPRISRYEGTNESQPGDTVLIWHNDTLASNYVIKSIK